MKIGDLARRSGVSIETIRYYERIGVMPRPSRSAPGHRIYDVAAQRRLELIRRARMFGFSLEAIGQMLALEAQGEDGRRGIREVVCAHLVTLRRRIEELENAEAEIVRGVRERAPAETDCPFLRLLHLSASPLESE